MYFDANTVTFITAIIINNVVIIYSFIIVVVIIKIITTFITNLTFLLRCCGTPSNVIQFAVTVAQFSRTFHECLACQTQPHAAELKQSDAICMLDCTSIIPVPEGDSAHFKYCMLSNAFICMTKTFLR